MVFTQKAGRRDDRKGKKGETGLGEKVTKVWDPEIAVKKAIIAVVSAAHKSVNCVSAQQCE